MAERGKAILSCQLSLQIATSAAAVAVAVCLLTGVARASAAPLLLLTFAKQSLLRFAFDCTKHNAQFSVLTAVL